MVPLYHGQLVNDTSVSVPVMLLSALTKYGINELKNIYYMKNFRINQNDACK
jgi:hypothetical protein